MKRIIPFMLSFLLLTACGIPQEDHDAALAKIADLEKQVAELIDETTKLNDEASQHIKDKNEQVQQINDLTERLTLYRNEANPEAPKTNHLSTIEDEYIQNFMEIKDFKAKYYDSFVDGRVPGVVFKIKNKGNKTLERVEVTVYFQDENNKNIAEEDYNPILKDDWDYPEGLKPNYTFQLDKDRFYNAKSVPEEWKSGNATIKITNIEFKD